MRDSPMTSVHPLSQITLKYGQELRNSCGAEILTLSPVKGLLCGEGPSSRRYWRTAALWLIVQPYYEDDTLFFLIFPFNGARVELNW
jgi:hypothetical protein